MSVQTKHQIGSELLVQVKLYDPLLTWHINHLKDDYHIQSTDLLTKAVVDLSKPVLYCILKPV